MRYPSDIIDGPLRLKPDAGLPSWKGSATACSHCARPIEEGDIYSTLALKEFFSDTRSLAATNGLACWRCVNLRKMPLLLLNPNGGSRYAGCFVTVSWQASNGSVCSMLSTVLFSFSVEKHNAEESPHWAGFCCRFYGADHHSGRFAV